MRTRMRALALALGLLTATQALAETDRIWTPWYLPRYAAAGFVSSINSDSTFSLQARLGWEITLIDQKTNMVAVLEGGPGYGISTPREIERLYQYEILAGVGLRPGRYRQLQWGGTLLFGAMIYGAHLPGVAPPFDYDREADGVVEGRLHLGVNLGPLALCAYFGVTQIWYVNIRKTSAPYVGGLSFGVLADWR